MMRELPKQVIEWSLVVALVLFLYGREQRHAGRDLEQSRSARAQIIAASDRADSLAARYALATRRGDSLSRLVVAAATRRVQAVAATDGTFARVDTILLAVPDTLRPALMALVAAVQVERLASDALVASLESSVTGLQAAIVVADSLLLAKDAVIAGQVAALSILERQAHPPILSRLLAAGQWVVVGAVAALAWVAVP